MSKSIKQHLYDAYGGFADKRVKRLTADRPFKVDDQSPADVHERFCGIFARVVATDQIELSLTNNAPLTDDVRQLVVSKGGTIQEGLHNRSARVTIDTTDADYVEALAAAVEGTVTSGKRYGNPNWKWLSPRTAASLRRFATELRKFHQAP